MRCLVLLLLAVPAFAQPNSDWSARYACYPNITDVQKADGLVPGWKLEVGDEDGEEVLALVGDEHRKFVGHVYIGRPFTLPERRPLNMQVSLELQAWDNVPDRSPGLQIMFLTPEAWETLAEGPVGCPPAPGWSRGQLVSQDVIQYPQDTTEWLPWTSGNLASRLAPGAPRELMLVIHFMGPQSGGTEYARFRKIEVTTSDELPPPPKREQRWPLKTDRMMLTAEQVELARERIETDKEARAILDSVLAACQNWLSVPDEDISWRIPDATVPRAFNISAKGSPTIGTEVYKKGTYPWILRFERPYTIECPITGEVYPDNDFAAWYRGNRQDASLLKGEYPDDGWGWVSPEGERYWLVGYANLWTWHRFTIPGALNLSRAYVLTGDVKYAHKAAAMLARIADVYPGMEYETQSRYGTFHPNYRGKILYHTWECFTTQSLAEAYDNIWDAIDGDTLLQEQRGQTGEQIRSLIETNLLQEAIDAVLDGRIEGNYGMHQRSMAMLVAARQNCPAEELLRTTLEDTGQEGPHEGVRFALYNWVHRDGVPYESAPGYSFSWVANLSRMAQVLYPAGIDLYEEPQFRRLVQWPVDMIVNSKHTPALGDSGDQNHGIVGADFDVYREAFNRYGGADMAWMLEKSGGANASFRIYEDLFREPLRERLAAALADEPRPAPTSRFLDGFGMGIFNNPAETVGLMCFYGWRGSHQHCDGLHLDLYAHGKALMPDTGYPDFMNALVPGIYTWSKATISHNTVTVDAGQQSGNPGGQVQRILSTPSVQYCDIDANGNYPQTSLYRRAMALISTDATNAYALDVFRVAGGKQHDYSLHGAVGERTVLTGDFDSPQTKGTLAGENVAVGEIYDNATMGAKGYSGGFSGYLGSGFQHLINARNQQGAGPVVMQVDPSVAPDVKLRMHILPRDGQRVILAEGQVSPIKRPDLLPFAIVRAEGEDLASTFVSVLEPFTDAPLIERVEALATEGDAVAVRVIRPDAVDVILQAPDAGTMRSAGDAFRTDAAFAVVTFDPNGQWRRVVASGGTAVDIGGNAIALGPPTQGVLSDVDPRANTVTVRWDGAPPPAASIVGENVLIINDRRKSVYRVTAAKSDGNSTTLTLRDSILNGRGRVLKLDGDARTLQTDSRMLFQAKYSGMRVTSEDFGGYLPIISAGGGQFSLDTNQPLTDLFTDPNADGRTEFWVSVAGPGDRLLLPPAIDVVRE